MSIAEEFKTDFTLTAKEILINLLNYANRDSMTTKLSPETTFFTKPKWLGLESDTNTEIRFASVKGFRIPQETESIFYNRLDINQLALLKPWDFTVYLDETKVYKTTHDLLDDVFKVFPIKLTKEDVVNEPVDFVLRSPNSIYHDDVIDGVREGMLKNKITFTIHPDSIGYYGSLSFHVLPQPIDINMAVRKRHLKGFTYTPTWGLS